MIKAIGLKVSQENVREMKFFHLIYGEFAHGVSIVAQRRACLMCRAAIIMFEAIPVVEPVSYTAQVFALLSLVSHIHYVPPRENGGNFYGCFLCVLE